MRSRPCPRHALTCLALSSLAALAQGQAATAPATSLKRLSLEELMSIEVTSVSKRPEKISDTASAIQVVTADDIRRAGVTRLPEALRLATNLQVAQIDSRQWAITARGFNNSLANKMLVLMDGRMLYTPLYAGVFWDVQDTLLEDIDRIEVISGPGATQWGANAVNGVVNVITKSAKDTPGGVWLGGGGDELRGFAGARYGGEAAPGVYYRIYAKYFDRDASLRFPAENGRDAWRMGQIGFRLDWDASADTVFTIQGDGYDGTGGQFTAADVNLSGGNLLGRWTRTLAPDSDVRLQLYYDRTHRRLPDLATADIDIYDLDFQHRLPAANRHDLVWGIGYRLIHDEILNMAGIAFQPTNTTRQWFTGFVQDDIALIEQRLHLTLGTKIEHNDYSGFEIQPSARLAWRLAPNQTLWSALSRAVRAPSRIDREAYIPGMPPFGIAGGAGFDSEKLLAYEVGYRVQPTTRLALSIAAFYHDYHDLRSLEPIDPVAPVPTTVANGLEAKTSGVELTADYHLTDTWRIQGGWTELRVHSEPRPGSRDFSSGRSQSLDPNHQVRLRTSIDLPGDIEFDATVRYTSRINNQDVPDYTELDVRLGWRPSEAWELSIVGQNLLHGRHVEFGPSGSRHEIERSVHGKVVWRF